VPKKNKKKPETPVQQPKQSPVFIRVERTLEVTVPDDISLENLATVYRLEGMRLGMETLMQLPATFRESVIQGKIPKQVETIKFIGLFRRAIADGLLNIVNQVDVIKSDLEKAIGFKADPKDANDLVPDAFIRVVRIPDAHDGGFYVEMDSETHGRGKTILAALKDLVAKVEKNEQMMATMYQIAKNQSVAEEKS
jgi:hypothetical protein